jgi:hypothetical protein
VDRTRVWLAASPLVAVGVLAAHALAYRATGTSAGSLHSYLDHAPQVLVVLTLVGLAVVVLGGRLQPGRSWPFAAAALAVFAVQEHVERLAHTGDVPWLLTTPVFLVGLLLQLPVALLTWALARWLLESLAPGRARRRHLRWLVLEIPTQREQLASSPVAYAPRGRAPPIHRRL